MAKEREARRPQAGGLFRLRLSEIPPRFSDCFRLPGPSIRLLPASGLGFASGLVSLSPRSLVFNFARQRVCRLGHSSPYQGKLWSSFAIQLGCGWDIAGRARVDQLHTRLRRSRGFHLSCLSGWDSDGTMRNTGFEPVRSFKVYIPGFCFGQRPDRHPKSPLGVSRTVPSLRSTLPAPIAREGHPCGLRGYPGSACYVSRRTRSFSRMRHGKHRARPRTRRKSGSGRKGSLGRDTRSLVLYGQAKTQEKSRRCGPPALPCESVSPRGARSAGPLAPVGLLSARP